MRNRRLPGLMPTLLLIGVAHGLTFFFMAGVSLVLSGS